jgi:hypothetical protein
VCPGGLLDVDVMDSKTQKRWRIFWIVLCLALVGMIGVQAALVSLDVYVSYSIYQNGGTTPLTNGALVYVFGSSNAVIDPMQSVGTNLVANSTTGDDVFLGAIRIGANVSSNGTFFGTLTYDSDFVKYVYIRFFDYTNDEPVTGMVYWGNSSNYFIGPPTLGVSTVDFNPNTDNPLIASNYNNFVVIPEPSSANLIVLVAGMAWAMRSSMKRRVKQARAETSEGGDK